MTDTETAFHRDARGTGAVPGYLQSLPRSVVRPDAYVLLDGEWRFKLDPEDRGLQDRWHLGHEFSGTARWPGSIESQLAIARRVARVRTVINELEVRPSDEERVMWFDPGVLIDR